MAPRGIHPKLDRALTSWRRVGFSRTWFIWFCVIVSSMAWLAGESLAGEAHGLVPSYQPDNVHRAAAALPKDVRRVVVLPLACDMRSSELTEGCDVLGPILSAELIKTKKFEVVEIASEVLAARTGRTIWKASDPLPADFFDVVREATGCDAVLFAEITVFRAYAPMVVGWRLRLVDLRSRESLWAADEVFDAGRASVAVGARRYGRKEIDSHANQWSVLNSPRQFGRYAAATLLEALPER